MLNDDPALKRQYANDIRVLLGWTSRESLNYVLDELSHNFPRDASPEYRRNAYRFECQNTVITPKI